jgi:hypothetical protein
MSIKEEWLDRHWKYYHEEMSRLEHLFLDLMCRVFHTKYLGRYPLPSAGRWHYSFCGLCTIYRYDISDVIVNWLKGYEFLVDPGWDQ